MLLFERISFALPGRGESGKDQEAEAGSAEDTTQAEHKSQQSAPEVTIEHRLRRIARIDKGRVGLPGLFGRFEFAIESVLETADVVGRRVYRDATARVLDTEILVLIACVDFVGRAIVTGMHCQTHRPDLRGNRLPVPHTLPVVQGRKSEIEHEQTRPCEGEGKQCEAGGAHAAIPASSVELHRQITGAG